ncbi:449_t:CDS:1 [Funneliformis geosporum]|nr:449_t:CDS:1 [Funneliformis geosporum]
MNKNYQELKIENNRKYLTIFSTIYSCLPKDSKEIISDNKIEIPLNIIIYERPLFDYPRFCKTIDTYNLYSMFTWIDIFPEQNDLGVNFKSNILGQEVLKLLFAKDLLLKQFILSAEEFNVHLTQFSGIQHTFSVLTEFEACDDVSSDIYDEMAQICTNIQHLKITSETFDYENSGLAKFIKAQQCLKALTFKQSFLKMSKELTLAIYDHINSIVEINIDHFHDWDEYETLSKFINLRKLNVESEIYCESCYNYDSVAKYLGEKSRCYKFPNLQTLILHGQLFLESVSNIINNTRGDLNIIYLSNCYEFNERIHNSRYYHSLMDNCPNLKYVNIYVDKTLESVQYLRNLLSNCTRIEGIIFAHIVNEFELEADFILELLGMILPLNSHLFQLQIPIDWKFSYNAFNRFFEDWRGRRGLRLYFYHKQIENNKNLQRYKNLFRKYCDEGVIRNIKFIGETFDFTKTR